ncbi:MAG TPA: GNAT family N-acetyltransferase [Albitalea sp.]|nr:GNAT family N-acetyltransferase [Albitalea sp.]
MIDIRPLQSADRTAWEVLARGYKAFYETTLADEDYERTWQHLLRADRIHGLGAHLDGRLVGMAHYYFHPSIWVDEVCYLQDLFVDPAVRGRGVARSLIEAVAATARARGADRLYWHTQQHNATARALYDKVAQHKGFIVYTRSFA